MTKNARPLVLTDLDDTLFVNQRKLPEDFSGSFLPVVEDTDDRVSGMTAKQVSFFRWIVATADVVPVTARSLEAFRRISLDFGNGWKIAGNGAVVISPDGEVDRDWKDLISGELADSADDLETTAASALAWCREFDVEVTVKRYSEHGLQHCVLLSHAGDKMNIMDMVAGQMTRHRDMLHVHYNSGVLAFTAMPVSKRRAVEYVMSKIDGLDERVVLGFGDSLSDMPFMSACDFMGAPAGCQIHNKLVAQIVDLHGLRADKGGRP